MPKGGTGVQPRLHANNSKIRRKSLKDGGSAFIRGLGEGKDVANVAIEQEAALCAVAGVPQEELAGQNFA